MAELIHASGITTGALPADPNGTDPRLPQAGA
jgi:hypothetical protein